MEESQFSDLIENNLASLEPKLLNAHKIIKCKVLPLGELGIYAYSTIRRVEIQYLDKKDSTSSATFIVKIKLQATDKSTTRDYNLFDRESYVYEKILTKMNYHLSTINCVNSKLTPQFFTLLKEPDSILLEDLSSAGYKLGDRRVGLNMDETLSVLSKIAKFHAASIKIQENHPELISNLEKMSSSEQHSVYQIFYETGIVTLYEQACQWEGYQDVAQKLHQLKDKIMDKIVGSLKKSSNCVNVLNHRDLWTDNILLKHNQQGKVLDSLMIDYQFVYWGSPGIDLNYFLFTSVENTVRKTMWNYLIHHYHSVLSSTLKDLGVNCRIPTVVDIHSEINHTGFQGFFACILKSVQMMRSNSFDYELALSQSPKRFDYMRAMFTTPEYLEFIKPLIREFYWMGYLD
ncbi:uncharacterized protein DMENIID0001_057080 [Sergentomyia squamirostris]